MVEFSKLDAFSSLDGCGGVGLGVGQQIEEGGVEDIILLLRSL